MSVLIAAECRRGAKNCWYVSFILIWMSYLSPDTNIWKLILQQTFELCAPASMVLATRAPCSTGSYPSSCVRWVSHTQSWRRRLELWTTMRCCFLSVAGRRLHQPRRHRRKIYIWEVIQGWKLQIKTHWPRYFSCNITFPCVCATYDHIQLQHYLNKVISKSKVKVSHNSPKILRNRRTNQE